jgi:hypothetical protein
MGYSNGKELICKLFTIIGMQVITQGRYWVLNVIRELILGEVSSNYNSNCEGRIQKVPI